MEYLPSLGHSVLFPSAHNTYNSLYVTTIHAMYRDTVVMATRE